MAFWTDWWNVARRSFGRGTFPHQLAFTLELPLRRLILSPEALADRLHLTPAAQVLEVGPGPGYFSPAVARRLPQGRLVLFDLQSEMLAQARRKLSAAGLGNVDLVAGDAARLPFGAGRFDGCGARRCHGGRSLSRVAPRDAAPGRSFVDHRAAGRSRFQSAAGVVALAERVGFEFIETFGRHRNYTANFRKASH